MDLTDEKREEIWAFASERVGIWEYAHGALGPDSRDCLVALLYGAILSNPRVISHKTAPGVPLAEAVKKPPACFCEHRLGGDLGPG